MIFIFINALENNSTHNSKCLLPKSKDLSIWKPLFPNGKIYIFWTKNETPFRKMCRVLFRIDFGMRCVIFANMFFLSLLMLSKLGLFMYYREFLKYKNYFFPLPQLLHSCHYLHLPCSAVFTAGSLCHKNYSAEVCTLIQYLNFRQFMFFKAKIKRLTAFTFHINK